jgi:hypothetical protein
MKSASAPAMALLNQQAQVLAQVGQRLAAHSVRTRTCNIALASCPPGGSSQGRLGPASCRCAAGYQEVVPRWTSCSPCPDAARHLKPFLSKGLFADELLRSAGTAICISMLPDSRACLYASSSLRHVMCEQLFVQIACNPGQEEALQSSATSSNALQTASLL